MLKSYSLKSTSETVVLEVDFLCEEKDMSSFLLERRRAGILMPLFSLPGKYGIGSFSKEAREFVRFLKEAGQSYWQILPMGPTGYGDSPYQSFSTFAGNPYFIDLDTLVEEGLLLEEELSDLSFSDSEERVDYGKLYKLRFPVLDKAVKRFLTRLEAETESEKKDKAEAEMEGETELKPFAKTDAECFSFKAEKEAYLTFLSENAHWLPSYAAFMEKKMPYSADFHKVCQYFFIKQWKSLKDYANSLGIQIIGDIPIYVSLDSSDILDHPSLFQLTENGEPSAVAGCPPDAFAENGQLWGNPLYAWEKHEEEGYSWWISRMKHCFSLYDIVRVDHFRGFDEYFSIPYGDENAKRGHWEKGPGMKLFHAMEQALGKKEVIAEDLGYVTESVKKLVKDSGFPGMKLLEFAFDSRESGDYRPNTWTKNTVCYTGTHDNQVLKDWFLEILPEDREMAADYSGKTVEELLKMDYVDFFIKMTLDSVSNTAMIPMQDYLHKGKEARINTPSKLGNNWSYRFSKEDFSKDVAEKIRKMAEESGRLS
ncbi:4-alpha-glucanotransferase [Oribacterium parvum ACB1]|uniref:4-alpha-glucanotransferase n=2 Tax=Oribacterium parvum TaxID=1501329 RepID=G9WQR9_9FIRM|nr:4-alpha-glucanotransferase [Oribacterium parvum ACB1]